MDFGSETFEFIIKNIVFPLLAVLWWGLNRRIDGLKKEIEIAKKELNKDLVEKFNQMRVMNDDQYKKIHKQGDENADLRTHVAEKFMMKSDYDRLKREK